MNYKDIDFTIENAEKYPDAELVVVRTKEVLKDWDYSAKRGRIYFYNDILKCIDWFFYSHDSCKLRIPVEYIKRPLNYWCENGGLRSSGYSIHIDENGNPVGEPFKTAP